MRTYAMMTGVAYSKRVHCGKCEGLCGSAKNVMLANRFLLVFRALPQHTGGDPVIRVAALPRPPLFGRFFARHPFQSTNYPIAKLPNTYEIYSLMYSS